ncbi:hypothetical protein [Acinetobacter radioresistens]|uniref:hypothetical protein n=1 Tax=Acinetobacter radioresistens TaxID=40216 RepID=UPI002005ED0A|nr:hypothetical protein [Acinetobacter radioresistens]MCK4108930.1 hypothetical protein [Acinetobacter radioresistens]
MSVDKLLDATENLALLEQAKEAMQLAEIEKSKPVPLVATLTGMEMFSHAGLDKNPLESGSASHLSPEEQSALRKVVHNYFVAELKDKTVHHPFLGQIEITGLSWKKNKFGIPRNTEKTLAIPAILDLLAKGKCAHIETARAGQDKDFDYVAYLVGTVVIAGKAIECGLSVSIDSKRKRITYNIVNNPSKLAENRDVEKYDEVKPIVGFDNAETEIVERATLQDHSSVSISTADLKEVALYDSSVAGNDDGFNIDILSITNARGINSNKVIEGRQNKVKTAKGTRLDTNLAIVEAADLIASHDALGNANPDYPQELQPRDRGRQSSQQQIHSIANDLDPDSLGRSNRADSGAPIIGLDRVVESGNGRTIAIKLAYQQGKAEDYKDWIIENAEYFGVNPEHVKAMQQPVLVRVRKTETDRAQFAVEANQDDKLSYSATERAKTDAKRISGGLLDLFNPGENGDLLAASNLRFIQGFLTSLGEHEAAQYTTTDGKPTQALLMRIKSAIFSKVYNDDRLLEMVADQTKPDLQNILNALSVAAPKFIEAQAASQATRGHIEDVSTSIVDSIEKTLDIRIVNAILDATNVTEKAKQSNQDIAEYVDQLGLFGDYGEGVPELAIFIAKNTRSAKKLSIAFKAMAEFAERTAVDGQNFGLFGEPEPVNIADAVAYANDELNKIYGNQEQVDFFDSAADLEEAARQSATSPENNLPEPTEQEQLEGNYLKGKVRIDDLIIAIENPAGSVRSGTDADGTKWKNTMVHHYGYIEGTEGADGDELDVFIKQGMSDFNGKVFVISQVYPDTQEFDEHKLVIGADTAEEAKEIYLSNYENGWQGFSSIAELSIGQLKEKLSQAWTKTTTQYDDAQGMEGFIKEPNTAVKIAPYFLNDDAEMKETVLETLRAVDPKIYPLNTLRLALDVIMFRGTAPAFVQVDLSKYVRLEKKPTMQTPIVLVDEGKNLSAHFRL